MAVLVSALAVVLALLAVLVARILRSHADRLASLRFGASPWRSSSSIGGNLLGFGRGPASSATVRHGFALRDGVTPQGTACGGMVCNAWDDCGATHALVRGS